MSFTLSETAPHVEPVEAPRRRRRWSAWLKYFALFLIFLWAVDFGISLLIRHTRLQKRLTARLESVFGRSVEVGRYNFSLWGGPTLEARSVTFSEDPRFGYEYFLRAESLTVRLRWESLFRGRLQLGTISLIRPSLNLVRNADGDWNVAEWLPKPTGGAASAAASRQPATIRFGRIEVDSGRINFKRASEKLPFALVNVSGYLEPDGQGRWTMNLSAVPTRAAVVVQQAGTIYVSGHVGGTSSRLRPAVLDLAWGDAALSDVLRLARGYDFGVRGNLALTVHADTESDNWLMQMHAELRQLHRWDFALRPDNPALNLNAKMILYPLASGLDVTDAAIEAPHSWAHAHARFSWRTPAENQPPPKESLSPDEIEFTQSQADLGDVLAWIRAFHPGVANDLALNGSASVHAAFSGWPPRLTSAAGAIGGADFTSSRLRVPVRLGQTQFRYDHEIFTLLPSTLAYGPAGGSLRLETISHLGTREFPVYHLSANLTQIRDLVATAGVLGWNISRGWDLSGPVRCDLRWPGAKYPWQAEPVGSIEWGGEPSGAALLTPFLNQPVTRISARAELKPGSHHIALAAADAFGAHWTGTFDWRDAATGWQFALAADRLSGSDLDRWLNPRWRESLLDRMLPFLNSSSPTNAVPENLRAQGLITVDQFAMAPLILRHLQGDLKVGGRHLQLTAAKAQFYGGNFDGSLDAVLTAIPSYRIRLDYSRVDLASLTVPFPTLANAFGGAATGALTLNFRGADRADLISSLECRGNARVTDPQIKALDLAESLRQGELEPGASSFAGAAAAFTCHDGKITFQNLAFVSPAEEITGSGSVDFSRNLDLRLRGSSVAANDAPSSSSSAHVAANGTYALTGPLQSPAIALLRQSPNRQ